MIALLGRDLRLARRGGAGALVGVLFLLSVVTLVAFGVGSELTVLQRIGPGILWAGTLLAGLLGMEQMFRPDRDDGTLDLLATSDVSWEAVAAAKALAHWLTYVVPLLAASTVLALLFGLTFEAAGWLALTLLAGTPALSLAGTLGAALGLVARGGGMLTAAIAVPFALPALIFGASAAPLHGTPGFATPFLLLCVTTLVSLVLMPLAAGAALRSAMDG